MCMILGCFLFYPKELLEVEVSIHDDKSQVHTHRLGETVLDMQYFLYRATVFIQSLQQHMHFLNVFVSFPHVCLQAKIISLLYRSIFFSEISFFPWNLNYILRAALLLLIRHPGKEVRLMPCRVFVRSQLFCTMPSSREHRLMFWRWGGNLLQADYNKKSLRSSLPNIRLQKERCLD